MYPINIPMLWEYFKIKGDLKLLNDSGEVPKTEME